MTPQTQAEQKAREFIKKLLPNMPNWTSTENRAFEELTLLIQKADALDVIARNTKAGAVSIWWVENYCKEQLSAINQARKES